MGDDGLSVHAGWITVYNANSESGEYTGVSNEYLPLGVSLPAGGYADAPTLPTKADKAVRRNTAGTAWEVIDDFRGETAYSTETGQPEDVNFIGELPDILTLLAPQTYYDKWNGSKWVTDKALQQAAAIQEAEEKKTRLLNAAAAKIAPLQDAVDTGMVTNDDKAQLTAWKTYRVLLSRIDTKAPSIEWPVAPSVVSTEA
ncbi:TPA: tail fiber assembly protein [Yersinia enterocolitica]|nr:tail fiber assembly protein [Yersinia enterocolitica]HEN3465583.1 tail fiber assembly protein [Yersinia enterocolitica]